MSTKKRPKILTQETEETSIKPKQDASKRLRTNQAARELIQKIVEGSKGPDRLNLKLAAELRDLKALVEKDSLLGGNTWLEWATKALGEIEINQLRIINDLALAPDEEQRAIQREQKKNGAMYSRTHRRKQAMARRNAERMAIERKWIIRWATAAPREDVMKAWRYIKKTYDA